MLNFQAQTPNAALQLNQCLAKTYADKKPGRNVFNHCQIVGTVALALLKRMPDWLVHELFPEGSELIAACHDLGKVSPTFQEKIYRGTKDYTPNALQELKGFNPEIEKDWGGHAGVSQATARHLKFGKYIPEILGQHHGYAPKVNHLATDEPLGGAAWQQRREELLNELKTALNAKFPKIDNELQARVLAGFVTVSDWLGSGSLFDDPEQDWKTHISEALDKAGFVQPLVTPDLSFSDIFDFKTHDTQQRFIGQVTGPGVYVLEAPMGLGKTEAALYAAYQMLANNQATGIYFALPTQLTSDKIHQRVEKFLNKILHSDSEHQQPLLLHSNAWLKTELGKEGSPGGSWFQAGKRGILAPFAVGTIDQALMAVMNVKHGFVRTFGLAGKVVILDEVHTYDSYTGTILDELVKALRQLHCTVIILSATLTQERRTALLGQATTKADYPLIVAAPKTGGLVEQPVAKMDDVTVTVQHCRNEELAMDEALRRAEQGQQVLWVENTVAKAQEIYRKLAAIECSPKIECGLLHSRFLKIHREENEGEWTQLYGKDAGGERRGCGRILVGTQVLEQSLDIDADFLISRFAPSDMLLQRIGRLWRHTGTDRPEAARREVWLLSPELVMAVASPDQVFGDTAKVYSPYVLCRSLEVWQGLQHIRIPEQIREVIEKTYKPRDESGDMLKHFKALEAEREKLHKLALTGLSKANNTLPEEKANTRYSEQDSVDVLLIKSLGMDKQRGGVQVKFLNGDNLFLPDKGKGLSPDERRQLSAGLLQNTLRVAEHQAPQALSGKSLEWLEAYLYLGKPKKDREESRLRVALVDDSDVLKSLDGGETSKKYQLSYNAALGYIAEK